MHQILKLATALVFAALAVAAAAAPPAPKNGLTDLAYSVQKDKRLYFTGKFNGKPVNMVRTGARGKGSWIIYIGALVNRVRMTIDDTQGLQEILAMDKGPRISVTRVGDERVEYRHYASNREYSGGVVLFRSGNRWLQGLMATEAFVSYEQLTAVADVTKDVVSVAPADMNRFAIWLLEQWNGFDLVATASAQEEDLVEEYVNRPGNSWEDAKNIAKQAMGKATIVQAASATLRLVAPWAWRAVGASFTVTGAPIVEAVAVGAGAGLAADEISGASPMQRVAARPSYDKWVATTDAAPAPSANRMNSLMNMSEQLDRADFQDNKGKAEMCILERNFACAEAALAMMVKPGAPAAEIAEWRETDKMMAREKARAVAETRQRQVEESSRAAAATAAAEAEQQAQQKAAASSDGGGFDLGGFVASQIGGVVKDRINDRVQKATTPSAAAPSSSSSSSSSSKSSNPSASTTWVPPPPMKCIVRCIWQYCNTCP